MLYINYNNFNKKETKKEAQTIPLQLNFPAFLLLLNNNNKLNIKCCYKKAITESNKKANFKRFCQNAYRGGAKPRQKPKNSEAGFASEQSLFTLLSW